ncbi:MAG: 16S rRNA (cytosine(1402)-N(4))-methyltransferase RsmH [Bacteroidetes bacterium]|nr:16S rRNA (cytosine(1402)-N(4))-methyltransferase RsmH [Bacteroidota bacterium]MCH8524781.1 16S rRNA (cytosine(1402)-N(4))-methyltransferase RsmH [Balneolales bacterium]
MQHITYHDPVLCKETVDVLITDPNGIYIDGTLGGGGHTTALLQHLSEKAQVYGIDQDDDALKTATQRINDQRFKAVKGNFGYMDVLLPSSLKGKITGILLDIGVSSYQIDEGSRGFSFREDGPLDMRMDPRSPLSAAVVVNNYDPAELTRILFAYGEERFSRKITEAIVNRRPVETTAGLRAAVEAVVKGPHVNKSLARVFQAIRIEVNQELDMLRLALEKSVSMLAEGGRIAVMSYHSLEDRLVKHFFRSGNMDGIIEKDFYGHDIRPLEPVKPALITPSEEEIHRNPRARSARLRVAQRIVEVKS